jgi:hypothetical protein
MDESCISCELISKAASALSEGDGVKFMGYVDKSAPHYYEIETAVNALTAQQDVSASIDVLEEKAEGDKIEALCDFFVQLTSQDGQDTVTRRRERVTIVEQKGKKGWKIASIAPWTILNPVVVQP